MPLFEVKLGQLQDRPSLIVNGRSIHSCMKYLCGMRECPTEGRIDISEIDEFGTWQIFRMG